jgi:hypothetical protein
VQRLGARALALGERHRVVEPDLAPRAGLDVERLERLDVARAAERRELVEQARERVGVAAPPRARSRATSARSAGLSAPSAITLTATGRSPTASRAARTAASSTAASPSVTSTICARASSGSLSRASRTCSRLASSAAWMSVPPLCSVVSTRAIARVQPSTESTRSVGATLSLKNRKNSATRSRRPRAASRPRSVASSASSTASRIRARGPSIEPEPSST